ncbi:hypothetical protein M6D93_06745 [Jatrophihabitans telluris]|uniref:CobQ/CobB/MinD/ParA nucleotide binding domain-containing protein n=1 Tax=Jatrophihabitans telluris TaxID=2038343 RepID=A0ABY4R1M2_9ACTN|nr:hypothetical protein [Jatrophihabitans telluris]UQX89693.1 hypothetical protein M6D93_06745 [Jatrophihabitans telluris]
MDLVELLAVVASGQAEAVLLDAELRGLDADAVDRMLAAGVAVVAVLPERAPAARGTGAMADLSELAAAPELPDSAAWPAPVADLDPAVERVRAVGVEHVVPANAAVEVFLSVVQHALNRNRPESEPPSHDFADPAFASSLPVQTDSSTPSVQSLNGLVRGSVVAVWGPTGAPGRSTVAVNLADEIAELGRSAMVVDADVYGGVGAALLGLLDESAGIAAACRQAQARRLDPSALASLAWQLNPRLRILTGLTRADRWPELRPTAFSSVLEISRHLVEFTVVDVGFNLESDEELSFDTMAPRRNGVTLAALEHADLVLAVASADPIGVQRLVRGLVELREVEIDTPLWVVANGVRRGPVPGDPRQSIDEALQRFAGRTVAAALPYDREGLDAALSQGKTIREAAPSSGYRRAMQELAAAVVGVPSPSRRRASARAGRRRA